jgi:two-component system phosphate regulon sensor histidine kinase PhoR
MFHSIRLRIAVPFVLLTLLMMLGLGVYISYYTQQTYLNNLDAQLIGQAHLIANTISASPEILNEPDQTNSLARRSAGLIGARVTVLSPTGAVLGESDEDPAQMENHLDRPEIQQALTQGQGTSTRYSDTIGYQMMYSAVPIILDGQILGFVRVALPLAQIQSDVTNLQRTITAVTLLAAALTILMAVVIAGRTTRPLQKLAEAARRLSSGELNTRLIPATPDEVGQLTRTFNHMAEELKTRIEELEAERSKTAAVLQEMTDGVLIVDRIGLVQMINPAAEKMFAVKQENALGRTVAEVFRDHQIVDLWQGAVETGAAQAATLEIGSMRLYLHGSAAPFGQALPGSILFVFQNLTRVRQLEKVRRDFISNISHELRTPLASLKALTETLQEGALEDPPAARKFLLRMETEVDALSQMVSELLELSRIESGRVPIKLIPTHPDEILTSVIERMHLQAERAGVRVRLDCPIDLPMILSDPVRLEQVVVNLFHNAIKFTPQDGTITLKAEQQNGSVLFSVSDTGIGIPAADLPRIFERFYKVDRARSGGGTGLGLAIARHIVQAHGGKIWAESREGVGSTFSFSIPIAH